MPVARFLEADLRIRERFRLLSTSDDQSRHGMVATQVPDRNDAARRFIQDYIGETWCTETVHLTLALARNKELQGNYGDAETLFYAGLHGSLRELGTGRSWRLVSGRAPANLAESKEGHRQSSGEADAGSGVDE